MLRAVVYATNVPIPVDFFCFGRKERVFDGNIDPVTSIIAEAQTMLHDFWEDQDLDYNAKVLNLINCVSEYNRRLRKAMANYLENSYDVERECVRERMYFKTMKRFPVVEDLQKIEIRCAFFVKDEEGFKALNPDIQKTVLDSQISGKKWKTMDHGCALFEKVVCDLHKIAQMHDLDENVEFETRVFLKHLQEFRDFVKENELGNFDSIFDAGKQIESDPLYAASYIPSLLYVARKMELTRFFSWGDLKNIGWTKDKLDFLSLL